MGQIKAVIFDFDGLLVDTESPAYDAWAELYREHGQELALELWVRCVGASDAAFDPAAHLASLTGLPIDQMALTAEKQRRKALICDSQPLMPGALALFAEAKLLGLPCAIASSSSYKWVSAHVARLGIGGEFAAIKTKDDVARVKPAPDLYLAAAAALGVAPADCLVFEDSLNGVIAAKAAGARCFAVPNRITKGLDFAVADGTLTTLGEIKLTGLTFP